MGDFCPVILCFCDDHCSLWPVCVCIVGAASAASCNFQTLVLRIVVRARCLWKWKSAPSVHRTPGLEGTGGQLVAILSEALVQLFTEPELLLMSEGVWVNGI